MNRIRVGLAAAAVLAVSACGSHPGSAVVVDGESLSTGKIDDLAASLCDALAASGQSDATGADARQQAASLMLTLTAARQAADELGVDVPDKDIELTGQEKSNLEQQFGDAGDMERVEEIVAIGKESNAIVNAIGADQSGSGGSGQQAGQQFLQEYIADADVEVDPRYRLDGEGQPTETGSQLAVMVSEPDETAPAAQSCSA